MNHENHTETNMEFHDHIYENVTNRYKYKIFNEIINSFTSKARDLSILKRRDKRLLNNSIMNPQHNSNRLDDSDTYDELNLLQQFANSYTSCDEDNIYENLEFFDNEIYQNESLSDWMRHLVHETADYETDNIMFVKSIPSVFNIRQSKVMKPSFNRNEITMNFIKTLWNRDDQHIDTITLLLQTFSSLLRDQSINNNSLRTSAATSATKEITMEKVSSKKLKKSSKKLDNRNYQKYQYVILSVSLNTAVITYSRSQKFYFSFIRSEVFFKIPSNVRARSLVRAIKINFVLKFANKSDEYEFYRQLRELLKCKLREISEGVVEEVVQSNESIYQQIWTCQSVANSDDSNKETISSENIYASLDQIRVSDDNEWEIDEEFSFKSGAYENYFESTMNQNINSDDYKTVWVLYSDENPDLNKFYYDSSHMNYLNSTKDNNIESKIIQSDNQESTTTKISNDIPEKFFESVDAWKVLLRNPYYIEDEEDIIVNDSVLSRNFPSFYDTEDESNKSVNASSNFSLPLDETASIKSSSHESYKSISEDALEIPEKVESPKKERERFRDKVRSKLKIRPSKASSDISSSTVSDSTSFKGEDDSEKYIIFGCSLEKVEKDIEHKDIPKIIVECIKALELDHNIKVSGIYRISGNKMTIDAIKKKMNEKKPPKKESKYACLIDQDVHTLTGLLKMFFRELTTPLMARNIFVQCTSERLSASLMREILQQMPRVNYETLKYLFKHFKTIEKYQEENLMNSGNLAICLGICLFSSNVTTPNPFDADISKCNMLCKYLIDYYYEVFESHL